MKTFEFIFDCRIPGRKIKVISTVEAMGLLFVDLETDDEIDPNELAISDRLRARIIAKEWADHYKAMEEISDKDSLEEEQKGRDREVVDSINDQNGLTR